MNDDAWLQFVHKHRREIVEFANKQLEDDLLRPASYASNGNFPKVYLQAGDPHNPSDPSSVLGSVDVELDSSENIVGMRNFQPPMK